MEMKAEEHTVKLRNLNEQLQFELQERKRVEETLLHAAQQWRTTFDAITDFVCLLDSEGRILRCNKALKNFLGKPFSEIINRTCWEIIHGSTLPIAECPAVRMRETRRRETVTLPTGDRWINVAVDPILDETGNLIGAVHIMSDITEQKRAEKALREGEDRYRDLVEYSQYLICTHDLKGQILSVNQGASKLLGYDQSVLLKTNIRDLLVPDVRDEFDTYLDTIRKHGVAKGLMLLQTATGEKRIWEYNNTLRTEGVTSPIVRAMAHDVTEQKQAEEEIKRNYDIQTVINSLLRLSLENISFRETLKHILNLILSIPWLVFESRGSIFLVEDDPKFLVMKEQNGLSEPIQKECTKVPFGKCHCGQAALKQEIQFSNCLDDRHEVRYEGITPHGHYCVPILFGGKTLGVLNLYVKEGHLRNQREQEFLTSIANVLSGIILRNRAEEERAALQEQLRQSQKMEAIGHLAGGIAHDFNNLLTVITGYSDLVLSNLDQNHPFYPDVLEIKNASGKAESLTRQLLAFSRKQVLQPKVLDLNTLVSNMNKMLRRLIGENIKLTTILTEDLGKIKIDPGQIEQVIINLAVNAKDAMSNGGKLTIETANVELDEEYARTHITVIPGRYVMLSVSDTGIGMSPEIREHIFEPFFTTKENGKGTGLGLSTVYGIVKQSGGDIWVYSEPGRGTTLKIYLPRIEETVESIGPMDASQKSLEGSETILLVEDEEVVRTLACTILQRNGYSVLEAANGEEALRLAQGQNTHPIHLMVTDVIMPGISGPELAKHLTSLHPEMKVLFMSGYTDNAVIHHDILEPGMPYLQKPFTPDGLARKVRKVLDGHS